MKTNLTTVNLGLLRNPDADWRPANDLSVPQIYLCENLLQKTLLALAHINARLLGQPRHICISRSEHGAGASRCDRCRVTEYR